MAVISGVELTYDISTWPTVFRGTRILTQRRRVIRRLSRNLLLAAEYAELPVFRPRNVSPSATNVVVVVIRFSIP